MLGKIYIIRNNVNDKVYIGQTIQLLRKRFAEHKRNSRYCKNKNCHISDWTVRSYLKKYDINIRPRGKRPLPPIIEI